MQSAEQGVDLLGAAGVEGDLTETRRADPQNDRGQR
jgi:hypothetical protein